MESVYLSLNNFMNTCIDSIVLFFLMKTTHEKRKINIFLQSRILQYSSVLSSIYSMR